MAERNWAGNIRYRASAIHRPRSVRELQDIVVRARQIRVLGTRHSFNHIADAGELVSLESMPDDVVVDLDSASVDVNPAITYGRLAELLNGAGVALHNMASLPHISVGGAVATGTHGSGDRLGNLATAVRAMQIVRSDGELVHVRRGDVGFDGQVVGLGALGVVVRMTLAVEPKYQIAQTVHQGLAWSDAAAHFDEVTAAGDSVSLFTDWREHVQQVWVKRRVEGASTMFGAEPATEELHPIGGMSAEHCTPQLGVPGMWSERLPHFKMGFTPSSGDELQSEMLLPRGTAVDAIEVMRGFADRMAPHLLISEVRTVAADDLWMSPQYQRDTVAIHCTWRPHPRQVIALITDLEQALAPYQPRPHWGKLFTMDGATLAERYPRHRDFVELVRHHDPRAAFRNAWFARTVLGETGRRSVRRIGAR